MANTFFIPQDDAQLLLKPFSSADGSHLALITRHTASFHEALTTLRQTDTHLFYSSLVCAGFWISSSLLRMATFEDIAAFYAGCNAGIRTAQCKTYCDERAKLIHIYKWCMSSQTDTVAQKLRIESIQNLITVLGPWASKDTIYKWTDQDLVSQSTLTAVKTKVTAAASAAVSAVTAAATSAVASVTNAVTGNTPADTDTGMHIVTNPTDVGTNAATDTPANTTSNTDLPKKFFDLLNDLKNGKQTKNPYFRLYGEDGLKELWQIVQSAGTKIIKEYIYPYLPATNLPGSSMGN